MPITTTVRIEGLRELGEAMRTLSSDIAQKVAVSATGAGAQIIKKRAVRNIETSPSIVTRSLHDAVIVKKIPKSQLVFTSEHIVTVRGKNKRGKKAKGKQSIAPHAHLIEFGTVKMAAEPFLGPAFNTEKERAVQAITDRLRKRIEAVK